MYADIPSPGSAANVPTSVITTTSTAATMTGAGSLSASYNPNAAMKNLSDNVKLLHPFAEVVDTSFNTNSNFIANIIKLNTLESAAKLNDDGSISVFYK